MRSGREAAPNGKDRHVSIVVHAKSFSGEYSVAGGVRQRSPPSGSKVPSDDVGFPRRCR